MRNRRSAPLPLQGDGESAVAPRFEIAGQHRISCVVLILLCELIMVIKLLSFWGEAPRMEPQSLPDNGAQVAVNCDFSSEGLRGIKDPALVSVMPNLIYPGVQPGGEPIVSVWTENGTDFFGWPWETDVVKSPVIDDLQKRIIYTGQPATGWIIKQARTIRDTGVKIIGNDALLGNGGGPGSGNYKPPEASVDLDSWDLGVLPPSVQGSHPPVPDEKLRIGLIDRRNYPDAFFMRLRVVYFIEAPTGEILWQMDVSNNEAGKANNGVFHHQVFYTNNTDLRGNKVQDMMWPLGHRDIQENPVPSYTFPRPYKYYWFDPPKVDELALTRTVTLTNNDASIPSKSMKFSYTGTAVPNPDPTNPNNTGGPPPPIVVGGV